MYGWVVNMDALQKVQCCMVRNYFVDWYDVFLRRVCCDALLRCSPTVQAMSPVCLRSEFDDRLTGGATAEILQWLQSPLEVPEVWGGGFPFCQAAWWDVWDEFCETAAADLSRTATYLIHCLALTHADTMWQSKHCATVYSEWQMEPLLVALNTFCTDVPFT